MEFSIIPVLAGALFTYASLMLVDGISARRGRRRTEHLIELVGQKEQTVDSNPLQHKLEEAVAMSARLVSITAEITGALDAQVAETARLADEAAETRAFMTDNRDVVIAVRSMLRTEVREELKAELDGQAKSDRRFQFGLSAISLLSGIAVTVGFQLIWTAITGTA